MLAHRLRRWPNIETALGECPVFAGWASRNDPLGLYIFKFASPRLSSGYSPALGIILTHAPLSKSHSLSPWTIVVSELDSYYQPHLDID